MIEITDLNKTYKAGNRALKHIDITIDDGEFVFIMGHSGSGKSTLLKLLLKEAAVMVSETVMSVVRPSPLITATFVMVDSKLRGAN